MKKHNFVYACSFFFSLGMNILNFSMVFRLADWFSFTPGQIGAFIAVGLVFYFAGCNLYHRFGSAFEPIRVFPLSATLVFLSSLPIGYSKSQPVVYAAYCLLQLGAGLFWPPVMAWLTSGLKGEELNKVIGRFNRSWMGANTLGPFIAGLLYHLSSTISFVILNISYCTAILILGLLFSYSRKRGESLNEASPGAVSAGALDTAMAEASSNNPVNMTVDKAPHTETARVDRKLDLYRYKGWINAFNAGVFVAILVNIMPLHLRDGLGFTERSAGTMLFIRSFTGFLGFIVLARFTSWHFNRRWFYILQGCLIASALLYLAAGNRLFAFFGIGIIIGFCNSGTYNNSIFYSSVTGKSPKKNLALHEIFLSIASAVGAAGGGFVYERAGFTGTCIAMLVVLLAGTAAQVYLDRLAQKNAVRLI